MSRFRAKGLVSTVYRLGPRVQGSGFRVQGAGFRVQGSGCRVLLGVLARQPEPLQRLAHIRRAAPLGPKV